MRTLAQWVVSGNREGPNLISSLIGSPHFQTNWLQRARVRGMLWGLYSRDNWMKSRKLFRYIINQAYNWSLSTIKRKTIEVLAPPTLTQEVLDEGTRFREQTCVLLSLLQLGIYIGEEYTQ